MYQILIADDEAIEREVIRFLLKKEHYPLMIREAANGKEALELLQQETFHILITDIKMPYIDGLELANRARERYPNLYIIFFSGYNDFPYVKEALSLHAVNYILKPVNPDEFQATISRIFAEIETHEELDCQSKEQLGLMKNHILQKLLSGVGPEELKGLYPHFDLSFLNDYHCLFLVNITLDSEHQTSDSLPSFRPSDLQTFLPENCESVGLCRDQFLLLFSGKRHYLPWYQELANRLILWLYKKYRLNYSIEISSFFSKPEEIVQAYEEVQSQLIQSTFFTNREPTDRNSLITSSEEPTSETPDSLLLLLKNDIQCKNAFHLKQHMSLLIDTCQNIHSHIYVRFLATNAAKLLLDSLPERYGDIFDKYVQAIYNYKHFSEIECLLKQLVNQVSETFSEEPLYGRHALQLAKHYILTHYGDDLSLDILAKEVCLSPRYLSSLFIEENGYGINKYIREVRMKKAKELLLDTNLKIGEIGRKVGYPNLSYFCKSFAREYGVTPEKFRDSPTAEERN